LKVVLEKQKRFFGIHTSSYQHGSWLTGLCSLQLCKTFFQFFVHCFLLLPFSQSPGQKGRSSSVIIGLEAGTGLAASAGSDFCFVCSLLAIGADSDKKIWKSGDLSERFSLTRKTTTFRLSITPAK